MTDAEIARFWHDRLARLLARAEEAVADPPPFAGSGGHGPAFAGALEIADLLAGCADDQGDHPHLAPALPLLVRLLTDNRVLYDIADSDTPECSRERVAGDWAAWRIFQARDLPAEITAACEQLRTHPDVLVRRRVELMFSWFRKRAAGIPLWKDEPL